MKHPYKHASDVSHYKFISLHGMDRNCLNDVDWDYKRERNKFHEIADTLAFIGATCLLAVVILLLSY
jgi:uncharacterized protein (DUF427 family)